MATSLDRATQNTAAAEINEIQSLREQFESEKRFIDPLQTLMTLLRATEQTEQPKTFPFQIPGFTAVSQQYRGNYLFAKAKAIEQDVLKEFEADINYRLRELLIKEIALETIHAASPNPPMHARKRAAQRAEHSQAIGGLALSHAMEVVSRVAQLLGPLRLKFRPFSDGSMADKLETMIVAKGSAAAANGGCPPTMKLCDFKTLQDAGACPWPDTNVWSFVPGGFCISSNQSVPIKNGQDLRDRVDRLQSQATDLLILFPDFKDAFNVALVDQDTITRLSTLSFEEADAALVSRTINYMYTDGNTYIERARKDLMDACKRVMNEASNKATKGGVLHPDAVKWATEGIDKENRVGPEGDNARLSFAFFPFWRLSFEAQTYDPDITPTAVETGGFPGGTFTAGTIKVDIPSGPLRFVENTDEAARAAFTSGPINRPLIAKIRPAAATTVGFDIKIGCKAPTKNELIAMTEISAVNVRAARSRLDNVKQLMQPYPNLAANITSLVAVPAQEEAIREKLRLALRFRRFAAAFVLYAQLKSNEVNNPLYAYTDDLDSKSETDLPTSKDGTSKKTIKWREAYKTLTAGLHVLGSAVEEDTSGKVPATPLLFDAHLVRDMEQRNVLIADNQDSVVLASYVLFPRTPDVLMMMCELAIACNTPFDYMFKAFKSADVKDPRDGATLLDLATSGDPTADGRLIAQRQAETLEAARKNAAVVGKTPLLTQRPGSSLNSAGVFADASGWSSSSRNWLSSL